MDQLRAGQIFLVQDEVDKIVSQNLVRVDDVPGVLADLRKQRCGFHLPLVNLQEGRRSITEVGLPLVSHLYYPHQFELHHLEEIFCAFRKAIDGCVKYRYHREFLVVFCQLDVVSDARPIWIGDFSIP